MSFSFISSQKISGRTIGGAQKIQMEGVRQSALEKAKGRLVLMSAFFVIAYGVVVARSADLTILQGALVQPQEENIYEATQAVPQKQIRGDILDRNGVLLARSLQTASLFADPKLIQNPERVAKDLSEIFPDISYGAMLQRLQGNKRFVWVKRNITPQDQNKILYLGHPGLNFKKEMHRVYPQGALASHIVGAAGVDGQGLAGIEGGFNDLLSSRDMPLHLTMDVRLQHVLKREIAATVKEFNAVGGAGVVMDIENGEVLAAVSLPDFDPHDFTHVKDNKKFNRFSLGVYELGSSFKIFSTAALLEKNNANMAQRFDVRKPLEVGRFKIRDFHPEKRILSLPEVFIHSSNIGSAMMGQEVGTQELKNFYKDIGLLDTPDYELPEKGAPIIPSPWREVNTLTAAYGHGIAVSPLQLVSAAASIVNGGILVTPTFVRSEKSQKESSMRRNVRVVSPQTSHRMRQLLRLVVTEGTGGKAEVNGFLVGGKTGTAEKPGKGGYNRKSLISSFIGVFPMDKPRYAVFVMVDEPKGTKASFGYATGGWVGAPTVKRVIASIVSILGIAPSVEVDDNGNRFEESLMRHVKTKQELKQERLLNAALKQEASLGTQ